MPQVLHEVAVDGVEMLTVNVCLHVQIPRVVLEMWGCEPPQPRPPPVALHLYLITTTLTV